MIKIILIAVLVLLAVFGLLVYISRRNARKSMYATGPAGSGIGMQDSTITLERRKIIDMDTTIGWFQSNMIQPLNYPLPISGFIMRYTDATYSAEWQLLKAQIPGFEPNGTTLLLGFFNKTTSEIMGRLPKALYQAETFSEDLSIQFGPNDLIIVDQSPAA
jgi:hypothetical protein